MYEILDSKNVFFWEVNEPDPPNKERSDRLAGASSVFLSEH